jgi:hypothetical protein
LLRGRQLLKLLADLLVDGRLHLTAPWPITLRLFQHDRER